MIFSFYLNNFLKLILPIVIILLSAFQAHAISNKLRVVAKEGAKQVKPIGFPSKKIEEISEKALVSKPLSEDEVKKKHVSGLEQVDIDPATKTLLSIIPKEKNITPLLVDKNDPNTVTRLITVKKYDTFIGIFSELGYGLRFIRELASVLESEVDFNPRSLKLGQKFVISERVVDNEKKFVSLQIPFRLKVIKIKRADDGNLYISETDKETNERYVYKEGKIRTSLINLAARQQIPSRVIAQAIKTLSNRVDLRMQLRKGDKFRILYKVIYDDNDKIVHPGKIVYVGIDGARIKPEAFRFSEDESDDDVDFYDRDGDAFRKNLTRNPLKKRFRVSSPFGYRTHPILKRKLMHTGIDYAAPRGTPIYAAGDGTVVKARRYGGYGNYVKIKHDSVWTTAYGHLKSFARGMRKWKRVKEGDLIGYVGSTGRSTGPHLHYEIIKYGKPRNPATIKLPSGRQLKGKSLTRFQQEVDRIEKILERKSA